MKPLEMERAAAPLRPRSLRNSCGLRAVAGDGTALLLAASFALYLSWALIVPFGSAPDEALRFNIVDFILHYHALPVAGDPRLLYAGGQSYAAMPYFSYVVSAGLCLLAQALRLPVQAYLVSRMVSVICGVATVFFVSRIARDFFKDGDTRRFVPVFFALIPQFAFISAYTNQDAMMVMLSAATIWLWLRGLRTNWDMRTVAWLGVVLGFTLLAYLNGSVLVAGTLLIVLLSYKGLGTRGFWGRLLVCVGLMAAVSGWFFIRNGILYHGDLFGLATTDRIAERLTAGNDLLRPSTRLAHTVHVKGLADLLLSTVWPQATFRSFWAMFDLMRIGVNPNFYMGLLALHLLSFMGLSSALVAVLRREGVSALRRRPFFLTLLAVALLAFALHATYSLTSDFQPQGRYMFPGLVAIVLLLCTGLDRLVSGRPRRWLYRVVLLVFIVVQIHTIYGGLLPLYLVE